MLNERNSISPIRSKEPAWRCQSRKFAGDTVKRVMPGKASGGGVCQTNVRRSASGNGRGRSRTACTTLKMAVLAPMPSASTTMAATEIPGPLAQHAHRVAQVAEQGLERGQAAAVTMLLARPLQAADLQHGLAPRFHGAQPAPQAIVDVQLEVAVELGVEIAVAPLAREHTAEPNHPRAQASHGASHSTFTYWFPIGQDECTEPQVPLCRARGDSPPYLHRGTVPQACSRTLGRETLG